MKPRPRLDSLVRITAKSIGLSLAIFCGLKLFIHAGDTASSPVLTVQKIATNQTLVTLITATNQTNILEASFSFQVWYPVLVYPPTNQTVTLQCVVTNEVDLPRLFFRVVSAPTASSAPPAGFTTINEAFSTLLATTVAAVTPTGGGDGRAGSLFAANQSAAAAAGRTEFQRSQLHNYQGP